MTIQLAASDLATGGNFSVIVTNPTPGGGSSNSANFIVYSHFAAPTWQILGPRAIPNAHSCDNANEANLLSAGKVQAFAIDLSQPKTMYAGGGIGQGHSGPASEAGVYVSTNGGTNWVQRDNGLADNFVDALWLDQNDPQVLVATTWLDGIYRTQDGGASWTNVYPSQATGIVQVGASLYAATANGVAVSSDAGTTWHLAFSTAMPVRALAAGAGAFWAGLDDGTIIAQQTPQSSWITVLPSAGSNSTAWEIAANPLSSKQAIAVVTEAGTFEDLITNDGGTTWSQWSAPAPGGLCNSGTAAFVAYDTVNPQTIYAGAGGALYVSLDGGNSWAVKHLLEDIRLI